MTSTLVKDSIVGDDWIRQTAANVPIQKIIDPASGVWNGDFLTGPVRLAFCDLFELPPVKPNQQNPKFGSQILYTPNVDFSLLYEEYYALCGREFPEYFANGQYHGLHSPFRDQAEKLKFSGYTPGSVFMTVTSKFKPPIVDKNMNPIVDKSKVYPGVWAICAINAYVFGKSPPQPKKGIAFGLQSVMIIGDDQSFMGQGPDAASQFAAARGIAGPVVRPGIANGMPVAAAPGGPVGMPGYGTPQPSAMTPHVPQTQFVPPQPGVAGGYAPVVQPGGFVPPAPVHAAAPQDEDDGSMYL